MKLRQAIDGLSPARSTTSLDIEVSDCTFDHRLVGKGQLFVARFGEKVDGHTFCASALENGAAALVVSDLAHVPEGAPFILVEDTRRALSVLANNLYGRPSEELILVGITGTNGKTSVTYIAEKLLDAAGVDAGVIGTVEYRYSGNSFSMPHTTPEAPVFCRFLRDMADSGVQVALTEVSSHALALQRVEDLQFSIAVFTNLSQDHLDYHRTLAEYGEVKKRLFTMLLAHSRRLIGAVINIDDSLGRTMAGELDYPVLTYGINSKQADISARNVRSDVNGVAFDAAGPWGTAPVSSPLVGAHNIMNILAALGIAHLCKVDVPAVAGSLQSLEAIPGRLHSVPNPFSVGIWVDYCHTPDAVEQVLIALRPVVEGRLTVVFGAGGDRDRAKRSKMGAVVEAGADLAIVTSDNPRSEKPMAIIQEILSGMSDDFKFRKTLIIPDRAMAIETAISLARPGDGILLGGKGHETYQLVGSETHHFDDREQALQAVENLRRRRA